jgi:hypothetical protein
LADAGPFVDDCFDILEVRHGVTGGLFPVLPRGSLVSREPRANAFPGEFGRNDVTNPEREGRPEPTGGTDSSTDGNEGGPEVRRRRVVLHQGLPDPIAPEAGAKFIRGADLVGGVGSGRWAELVGRGGLARVWALGRAGGWATSRVAGAG